MMNTKGFWIILVFYAFFSCTTMFGQTKEDVLRINEELSKHNVEADSISNTYFEELKRIGLDSTTNFKVRQEALILIGKIQTTESIRFLIDNISIYIFNGPYDGDVTELLEHPCYYALMKDRDRNWCWYIIPEVLASLKKEKKDIEEIKWIAQIFKYALHSNRNLPIEFIETRMRGARPPFKENMEKILAIAKTW